MQRIPVDSSDIISIGYEPKSRLLEIEFHGGRLYQYRDVEATVHEQFMRADSHGQFFNTFIHSRYRYDKVTGNRTSDSPAALAFVTSNERKVRDLQAICEPLGVAIEQLDVPVDEVQATDAQEVALKKAKAAYKVAGRPVLVNDIFWNILALRGFPGAYMSAISTWLRPEDFLRLMEGKADRTVYCTETYVYYDGTRSKVFSDDYKGSMATEAKGAGDAFSQVVIMDGHSRTVAEQAAVLGMSSIDPRHTIGHEFAKWYRMQQRLGRA